MKDKGGLPRYFEISMAWFLFTLLVIIIFLLAFQEKKEIVTSFYCNTPVAARRIAEAYASGDKQLTVLHLLASIASKECVVAERMNQRFAPVKRLMTFGRAGNGGFVWAILVRQRNGRLPIGYAAIFENGVIL